MTDDFMDKRELPPTHYGALLKALRKNKLSWDSLEAVVLQLPDHSVVVATNLKYAKGVLKERRLEVDKPIPEEVSTPRDDLAFYAYTEHLIFFLKQHSEFGYYNVNCLPRAPTDEIRPRSI